MTRVAKRSLLASAWLAGFATLLTLGTCDRAAAVDVPITNNSFETPDVGGTFLVQVPDGWTASAGLDDVFVEDSGSLGFTNNDGLQYAGMDSDVGAGGYIYQDLGIPFEANMTYRVDLAGVHRSGFTHGTVEFGVFSSNTLGTTLGTEGFIDLQGFWSGSGNPDGDDVFNEFRDASTLQTIGSGAMGRRSKYDAGASAPGGNVVVFIRGAGQGQRVNFDNIRLDVSTSLLPGDVNDDGTVDLIDYGVIRDNFQTSVAGRSMGDLTEDGRVDFFDFLEWRDNATPAALAAYQSIPEPASAVLVLISAAAFAGSRRRAR